MPASDDPKPPPLPTGKAARTPAKAVERADDTARALNMTRQGMTVRAIAKVLGCSPTRVHELVKAGREAIPAEERDRLIAQVVENLAEVQDRERGVIQAHWRSRRDPDSAKAITASDKVLLDANRSIIDLFGLAAPKRTELSGPNGGPVNLDMTQLSDVQIEQLSRGDFSGLAGESGTRASPSSDEPDEA